MDGFYKFFIPIFSFLVGASLVLISTNINAMKDNIYELQQQINNLPISCNNTAGSDNGTEIIYITYNEGIAPCENRTGLSFTTVPISNSPVATENAVWYLRDGEWIKQ